MDLPGQSLRTSSERSGDDLGSRRTTWETVARAGARLFRVVGLALASYFALCVLLLILYNWSYPPTTAVHIQRRAESWFKAHDYEKRYVPMPASSLSSHLPHAVIAAEDTRFYSHAGFDWDAIRDAYEEGGRRGASTISQQLAKNLFLTTHRSYVRKLLEVPLTFLTEIFLPKDRILAVYVNVVEWGDGIYGAESASQAYFGKSATQLTRHEAAALAACLPNPRVRRPRLNGRYTRVILQRMETLGY